MGLSPAFNWERNSTESTAPGDTKLPDDILTYLFEMVLDQYHDTWAERTTVQAYQLMVTPFSLASICRRWRNVAINTPKIWVQIVLYTTSPHDKAYVELMLSRSKSMDIDVSIGPNFNDKDCAMSMFSLDTDLLSRLRRLSWEFYEEDGTQFRGHIPLFTVVCNPAVFTPRLIELRLVNHAVPSLLNPEPMLYHIPHAPALQKLSFISLQLPVALPRQSNLRALELVSSDVHIDRFQLFLARHPHLKSITLSHLYWPDGSLPGVPISLPELETLILDESRIESLHDFILPQLRRFINKQPGFDATILAELAPNSPGLHDLHFSWWEADGLTKLSDVSAALAWFSELRTLSFKFFWSPDFEPPESAVAACPAFLARLTLKDSGWLCPRLTELSVVFPCIDDAPSMQVLVEPVCDALLRLVEARSARLRDEDAATAPVGIARLNCPLLEHFPAHVRRIEALGAHVEFEDEPRWINDR